MHRSPAGQSCAKVEHENAGPSPLTSSHGSTEPVESLSVPNSVVDEVMTGPSSDPSSLLEVGKSVSSPVVGSGGEDVVSLAFAALVAAAVASSGSTSVSEVGTLGLKHPPASSSATAPARRTMARRFPKKNFVSIA